MRRLRKTPLQTQGKLALWIALVLVAVGACFAFSPVGTVCADGWRKTTAVFSEKARLRLEQVVLDGHQRTTRADVYECLNQAGIALAQGEALMRYDIRAMQRALQDLPWVRHVHVERHLPDTLVIKFIEKKPIALWQNRGNYLPLDEDGAPIQDTRIVPEHVPLVVGEDAPAHAPALVETLALFPEVALKVRSAVRVGNRRWNLILNNAESGTIVNLPETDIGAALRRLEELNQEDQLLRRELKVIDLRYPDRLIIRAQDDSDTPRSKGK